MGKIQERVRVGKWEGENGVYARRKLRKGMIVGELTGEIIDDPDYWSSYCVDMGGPFSLEIEPPLRFLNHCCVPNCAIVYDEEDEDLREEEPTPLYLEVLATIQPGEQLTIDYAWNAAGAIPCLCGHEECRGWVVDPEELDIVLRREARAKKAKKTKKTRKSKKRKVSAR